MVSRWVLRGITGSRQRKCDEGRLPILHPSDIAFCRLNLYVLRSVLRLQLVLGQKATCQGSQGIKSRERIVLNERAKRYKHDSEHVLVPLTDPDVTSIGMRSQRGANRDYLTPNAPPTFR